MASRSSKKPKPDPKIEAEIRKLEAALDLMGQAEDAARCPTCCCSKPKAREGQERARISGRIASLRAKQAYADGKIARGIQLDELANKYLTNERQMMKAWANDEMIAIRELLDKATEQTDRFRVLRGRPKKKRPPLTLAPQPD
jgi:hypothetical protein